MSSAPIFPPGFLEGSAPNPTKAVVDFDKAGIPEYRDLWAVILDGLFSDEECNALAAAAEATTGGVWERAKVNVG